MLRLVPIVFIAFLSACSSSGPSVRSIFDATLPSTGQKIPVVDFKNVPPEITKAVAYTPAGNDLSRFASAGVIGERVRTGDVIEVTIYDSGEEGLFSSTDSKVLQLGNFTVDQTGFINLPFVGKIEANGVSPDALQGRIVEALRGSAVNPQAVVRLVESPNSSVMVSGNVNSAGRVPLTGKQTRLIDIIAQAGGAVSTPGSTKVTLVRGSHRGSAQLDRIQSDNSQNVHVLPGDQIIVEEAHTMTLSEAVGKAGGLASTGADPKNVYLFRNQPAGTPVGDIVLQPGQESPIIYRIDMSNPGNIPYMQQFIMQNGDVLYAAAK